MSDYDPAQLARCEAPPAGLCRALALALTTLLRFRPCLAWTARRPRPPSVAIETEERWACELERDEPRRLSGLLGTRAPCLSATSAVRLHPAFLWASRGLETPLPDPCPSCRPRQAAGPQASRGLTELYRTFGKFCPSLTTYS